MVVASLSPRLSSSHQSLGLVELVCRMEVHSPTLVLQGGKCHYTYSNSDVVGDGRC